jgi:uncharacterized membrane protein
MMTAALISLHVLAAAFWVGATIFLVGFVGPAVARAGADGGAFMQSLVSHSRFPVALGIAGGTTVLSGVLIFWILSGGFAPAYMHSSTGMLISYGAACGTLAIVTGVITGRLQQRGRPFAIVTGVLLVSSLVLMTLGAHV